MAINDYNKKMKLGSIPIAVLISLTCSMSYADVYGKQPTVKEIDKITNLSALAQQREVTVKVVDEDGSPIAGATIIDKQSDKHYNTDASGTFKVTASTGSQFSVTYVGYTTQTFIVGVASNYTIKMTTDEQVLEDLVVVGYGVQKKVNLTGAVASISAKELENRPVTNSSTALQGALPGVTVIQSSGQPGKDNSSIRIRGIGTLNNSNPMYVVDGMVVPTINDIDPNDIESLSVLKDAASAAIYGSRAANGVILVKTKSGGNREPTLRYDGYEGWQSPTALQEYLPSWEYAELYNKALINERKKPLYSVEEIQKFKDGSDPDNYPNTDWLGLFYKDRGAQRSHRIEVAGGSERSTYMISAGYLGQDGIIPHAKFNRYNARANVSTQIKRLTAKLNTSYVFGDIKEPSNPYTGDMYQIFRQINRIAPFVTNKYSNGFYGSIPDGNPMEWLDNGSLRNEKYHTTRLVGDLSYQILDGLRISETIGYEYTGRSDEKFIKDSQFYDWKTGKPSWRQGPNSQTDERNDQQTVSLQTLLTYDKSVNKHTFGAIAGYSQEYTRYDWTKGYRKNFLNNDLWELNAGSPEGQEATGAVYERSLMSFFGRINYNFDDRFLFEANVRRDGTSRISKDGRWGTFPSFSGAWRIINEAFMKSFTHNISDLKLRAGWGKLGNQSIDSNYPYQSVLEQKNYSLGGKVVQGVAPVKAANGGLLWETSESLNIGLDLAFYNNRYTFTVDWYNRDTDDILLQLPISGLVGLEAPYQNAGKVRNRGIDAQFGYNNTFGDWKVYTTLNMGYNDNKILDLKNDGAKIWDGYSFRQEGRPINAFGGYEVLGIFQTEQEVAESAVINRNQAAPGDFKYRDVNNDGKINDEDRVYLGSWAPKLTFGANLGVSWKTLDLIVQLSGAANVKGYLQNETIGGLGGNTSKPSTMFRDSWDAETNPNGKFPRPLTSWSQNESSTPSSYWIVNSSYLRFKNIQVGYVLPETWTDGLGLSKLRVYYSGQNLFTISSFNKGFDPEAPAGARAFYPQVKVHTFGLNVTF